MIDNQAFSDELTPQQERLIACLVTHKTKRDAAKAADVVENTMYRWLRQPAFVTAYRAARFQAFEEALGKLAIASPAAADVVIDAIGKRAKVNEVKTKLALAIIDRALTAHQHIGIEQELDRLRQSEEEMTAMMASSPPVIREVVMTNDEQGEADRLRVRWMGLMGHSRDDIDQSLRYNRPASVAEERQYLHIVEEMQAEERKYPREHTPMLPAEVL